MHVRANMLRPPPQTIDEFSVYLKTSIFPTFLQGRMNYTLDTVAFCLITVMQHIEAK